MIIPRRASWAVVTVLSLLVGLYAIALIASGFELVPDDIAANRFWTPSGLHVHIVGATVAILTMPWQLSSRIRTRRLRLHRVTGRLYVGGVVVGGLAGGAIALTTTAGTFAGLGFLGLAIAWVSCTLVALRRILTGHVADHRRWMLRSAALTFAAVTLRLYLGLSGAAGIEFDTAYPAIAWLCWVPNLVVAELWLRRQPACASISSRTRAFVESDAND